MREILFRGKTPKYEPFNEGNNDKWVEGHFCKDSFAEKTYINENVGANNLFMYMAIPETVGEHTGLKDKNGSRIFEGDIVMVRDGENHRIMSVMFINGSFCFTGCRNIYAPLVSSGKLEVVGNIHDTPLKMRKAAY